MHFAVEVLYFYACWGGQIVNMGIRFFVFAGEARKEWRGGSFGARSSL